MDKIGKEELRVTVCRAQQKCKYISGNKKEDRPNQTGSLSYWGLQGISAAVICPA